MENEKYYNELVKTLSEKVSRDNKKLYDDAAGAIAQLVSIVKTLEDRLDDAYSRK